MKIGILTYHAVCNFGANLQALSTVAYLKNRGYDPIVIDWLLDELDSRYRIQTPAEQYDEHFRFREAYLPMSHRCRTAQDVADVIDSENIDAVIVGSDAVLQHFGFWSRVVFPSRRIISFAEPPRDQMCPNPFWGSFVAYLKRPVPICMMSASSQNAPYPTYTRRENSYLASFLRLFSYISVRDSWTGKMVRRISGGSIVPKVTPDPVFGFNYNVGDRLSKHDVLKKFNLPDKYVLVSFHNSRTVSQEWLSELRDEFDKEGIECVAFPFPQGIEFEHPFRTEVALPLSPIDWYYLIKYSQGYIGHNMHPVVVSLHNGVPCYSFDNYGVVKFRLFVNQKSSKIYHIMKEFGVEKNCFPCKSRFKKNPAPQSVVKAILEYDRKSALACSNEYLDSYLEMMRDIEGCIKKVDA